MKAKINIAIIILFFSAIIPAADCNSQNLLSMPESIIFDNSHNRYLISNYSTGDIIQAESNGVQSYFVQGKNAIQGLEIVGNAVYAGCGTGVRGFNLESGEMIMDVQIPSAANINDITADESGNLYASEVFGTRIFKIKISTHNYSVFVDGQGILRPNGLYYDRNHNRILVCSFRNNSPIQAIDISDSTVTTITNTNISNCDGITKDRYNRYYVTSWATKSIYRYDSIFTNPPITVYQNNCGAADISYDSIHDVIAMPLQPCNSWGVLQITHPAGIKNGSNNSIPDNNRLFQNYPNPFNPNTSIRFDTPKNGIIKLIIYDALGREVQTLVNERLSPGTYEGIFNGMRFNSGVYFYRLIAEDYIATKKMLLLK